MINNENLIGNSKHMTDFLGNSYDYGCLGCSMGKKEIIALVERFMKMKLFNNC